LFNYRCNLKRAAENRGDPDPGIIQLWLLEDMEKLCKSMEWSTYPLPSWTRLPEKLNETLGLQYKPVELDLQLSSVQVSQ
jgi:hypothetical protein